MVNALVAAAYVVMVVGLLIVLMAMFAGVWIWRRRQIKRNQQH